MSQRRPEIPDPFNAFCKDTDAFLQGTSNHPLSGLTFAAKDIFDVAGHLTGAGNPDWKRSHEAAGATAWAVQALVDAGATMVGKTITDELTRGILGENAHYGTPINPRAPGRVPGGSSSGSAVAVAGELVDFALGSDTGGSVRVPASFCGLYGLRPTHGRIPLDGMLLQAPSYDTIGWFTREPATFAKVGAVLLNGEIANTRIERLVIAEDAFELADKAVNDALRPTVELITSLVVHSNTQRLASTSLADWSAQQQILQSREGLEMVRDWINQVDPRLSFRVAERYVLAERISDDEVDNAKNTRDTVISHMDALAGDDTLVCLPTVPSPAPLVGLSLSSQRMLQSRIALLTCVAGITGRPQVTLPVAEVDGLPVGLSLLGARGSDEELIAFAQVVSEARMS